MRARSSLRNFLIPLLLAGSAVAFAACQGSTGTDADESGVSSDGGKRDGARDGGSGALQLVVTVDWEGRDLLDENLRAMEELERRFPDVRITHFLNAAYFTKIGAVKSQVATQIRRVVRTTDDRGLHIHGWKRLFEASGVTFRDDPTFWGRPGLSNDCNDDCGHEVPISAYTADELTKVIRFSVSTLSQNGFGRAQSFRAGGWMAAPNVREALVHESILWEHSAVPPKFLKSEISTMALYGWVDDLWGDTDELSQPYALEVQTASKAKASITEIPDNGALADYMYASEMTDVFDANKEAFLRDRSKNVVVSIGFHQETAGKYVSRVEEALTHIYEAATREHLPLVSVTSKEIGERTLR